MPPEIKEGEIKNMLLSLANAFTEERHKEQPYKEMFKAGSTHTGLLRNLQHKMIGHVLDACDIYKERHGMKINAAQFNVLLALPFLAKVAEQDAEKNEGSACCVDKAYFMLSEQLKALAGDQEEPQKAE